MKSVLISIQPKWVEKIISRQKTVEVRKNKPNLATPFKCYIYCTKGKPHIFESDGLVNGDIPYMYNGYVIGEFVCDKIDKVYQCNSGWVQEYGCISRKEFFDYLGIPYNSHFDGKGAFAWHISDLKIYDEPKELSEFRKPCKFAYSSYEEGICYENCIQGKLEDCRNFCLPITRPPQSWCYVESLGE